MATSDGLVFALVANAQGILAESGDASFQPLAKKILEKLALDVDMKKNYNHSSYNFSAVVSSNLVFLCISNESFAQRIAFGFLEDVRLLWIGRYGQKGATAVAFEMNDEFSRVLHQKMDFYSNDSSSDKIRAINNQIELVKTNMLENMEKVIERGENIDRLVTKTEGLRTESATFKVKAAAVKRKFWWKNVKLWVGIVVAFLVLILIAVAIFCGFPSFSRCTPSPNPPSPTPSNSTALTPSPTAPIPGPTPSPQHSPQQPSPQPGPLLPPTPSLLHVAPSSQTPSTVTLLTPWTDSAAPSAA